MNLGRRAPSDWRHVERYPLSALREVEVTKVPVVLGINWYSSFDSPEQVGASYWIGRGELGSIRGGHAICCRPYGVYDYTDWWDFYDQGSEGACVGFSEARMQTLLNRRRYEANWLYREAKEIDEWPGTNYEGTSVRAGAEVLRERGIRRYSTTKATLADGIAAYRWATSWDEVRAVLGQPDDHDGVQLLNSWGRWYPHFTWITDEAGARLLAEDGEALVVTDR